MSSSSMSPSPSSSVRLATIGAIITWSWPGRTSASPSQDHSSSMVNSSKVGRYSHSSPLVLRGKHAPTVGSQYSPSSQSLVESQVAPGVVQAPR